MASCKAVLSRGTGVVMFAPGCGGRAPAAAVLTAAGPPITAASFSTSRSSRANRSYKVVIAGSGAGGTAMAQKFAKKIGAKNIGVIEPSETHFYQPLWTLVGGGLRKHKDSVKEMSSMLPRGVELIKDAVVTFDPDNNKVVTKGGDEITYEYLIVAMGITLRYDMIKGLPEAFESDPTVCSNYHTDYVQKTYPAIEKLEGGNAIFTFPNTPIKCAGAPQKICYITDDYLRRKGKRDKVKVMYNTSLPVIFGIPHYAAVLNKMAQERDIEVNIRTNLIEVKPDTHEAVFEKLGTDETVTYKYSMLHVGPPCSPPEAIKSSPLADEAGFLAVSRDNLQHVKYPNVFGIGDCTSLPTAKTAAGVASQSGHLQKTILEVMDGKQPSAQYNGYTSCPLVTGKGKTILAEFGYDGAVLETFPIDQRKQRFSMFLLKTYFMPELYWHGLVKGIWNGPSSFRKVFNIFSFGK